MKNKETFASRARKIKNKYTRAEWDMLEKKDMMKELSALRDEQEAMRAAMGIADYADQQDQQEEQMAYGGGMYDGLNNTQYLKNDRGLMKMPWEMANESSLAYQAPFEGTPYRGTQNQIDKVFAQPQLNYNSTLGSGIKTGPTSSSEGQYQPIQSSALPFAVSAGVSAIGDIASMISARRNMPKSVNLPRMTAEQINLQPQREALQRGYNTASNVMLRNARDVSSPANAYANQIAGQSGLMDSFGTQMGQSYMNEANTNAQMRQQAGMQNQQVGAQEALQNMQLKQQNAQVKNQFINSLSQTIPNALRDYRQQVNQDNMINMMGLDYGAYDKVNPNMTFMEKLQMGLLGGHNRTILNRRDPRINNQ
jgi:hypothetical protein